MILFLTLVYVLYDLDFRSEMNGQAYRNLVAYNQKVDAENKRRDEDLSTHKSQIDALLTRVVQLEGDKSKLEQKVQTLEASVAKLQSTDQAIQKSTEKEAAVVHESLDVGLKADAS